MGPSVATLVGLLLVLTCMGAVVSNVIQTNQGHKIDGNCESWNCLMQTLRGDRLAPNTETMETSDEMRLPGPGSWITSFDDGDDDEKECGGCSSQPATLEQRVEPCWENRVVIEWVDKLCDWARELFERAREAWEEAKKKIEELKQKIEDWKQKVFEALERLRELKAIVEALKDMVKILRDDLKKLREEWDKMMQEFMKAFDALDYIEKVKKGLENEVKKAEKSLEKDLDELSKAKDKVALAKARFEKANRDRILALLEGTLNDRVNKEFNDALAEYSSALDALAEAFTKATEGANKLAKARSELRRSIEAWSHALYVLWNVKKALEEARKAYEDKENDLKKAKDAEENAKKLLKEARDSLQNEEDRFEKAKTDMKAKASEFESAERKRLTDWNCRIKEEVAVRTPKCCANFELDSSDGSYWCLCTTIPD